MKVLANSHYIQWSQIGVFDFHWARNKTDSEKKNMCACIAKDLQADGTLLFLVLIKSYSSLFLCIHPGMTWKHLKYVFGISNADIAIQVPVADSHF